jgi:hypothetical protein
MRGFVLEFRKFVEISSNHERDQPGSLGACSELSAGLRWWLPYLALTLSIYLFLAPKLRFHPIALFLAALTVPTQFLPLILFKVGPCRLELPASP